MKASVESRIIARLEEFTEALEHGDKITERFACRRIALDLKPQPYDPEKVKMVRGLLRASQAVLALFLGVSPKTVQAWENGVNAPNKMACRFMDEILKNPKFYRKRLEEALLVK
jgi:putative transcriptional regulator